MRQRKGLYLSSTILRGRRLKSPEEDGGGMAGGIPDTGGNNAQQGGGNSTPASGTPGGDSNNTSGDFDPSSFWDEPPGDTQGAPPGESASPQNPSAATSQNPPPKTGFADSLTQQLTGMQFGEAIFTPEIAEEISQGKFDGFQKRVDSALQTAVRQALSLNVQVLRPFAEQLMNQMREEFGTTLSQRDDGDVLVKDFPAAANPQVAPIIKGVYEQALRRTKGNRQLAVKQTKQMLAFMANQTADDIGLDVAPQGAGDSRPQQPAINWLDELTGRSN